MMKGSECGCRNVNYGGVIVGGGEGTACFSTFATSLGYSKPQFILELLFRHFDGGVE
jgi:hypothetical protein